MTLPWTDIVIRERDIWMTLAAIGSVGYAVVLSLMIRSALQQQKVAPEDRPPHRPLFYFGQAYLGFMWPLPLYLTYVLADLLGGPL